MFSKKLFQPDFYFATETPFRSVWSLFIGECHVLKLVYTCITKNHIALILKILVLFKKNK